MSQAGQQHHHHGGQGGHAVHSPGGGGGTQHNFLSHLLGLDHDAHVHGGGHGDMGGAPSQSAGWNSALQSVKLADVLQGIKITPNFLFILMFCGFASWLGVIYWVRHHEPLANGVLGTAAAHCATSAYDRQLLNGTKHAFPGRTCPEMGDIYVPTTSFGMPVPQLPVPAPPFPEPKPVPLSYNTAFPEPGSYIPAFGRPVQRSAFLVPEPESAGTRLRTIVNR